MKLSANVIAAGNRWVFEFPPPMKLEDVFRKDSNGELMFDDTVARQYLSKCEGICWANTDNRLVLAIVLNFLEVCALWREDAKSEKASSDIKTRERIERRSRRDMCTKVRVKIQHKGPAGVLFDVDYGNPDGVVEKERYERFLALIFADLANSLKNRLARSGYGDVIELSQRVKEMVAEVKNIRENAALENEISTKNAKRHICKYYYSGDVCSPCQFNCEHYRNGRCVDLEIPKRKEVLNEEG